MFPFTHTLKQRDRILWMAGKYCSNFAAPSPGAIASRNYGRILFASPTSPRTSQEQRGEALRSAPVSPLAWHVACGKTQSRGTNMAEYNEG